MSSTCQICDKRRAKRTCPGVRGEICPQCCGEQREVTIHCPLDCEFLVEARLHERLPEVTEADIPHKDVELTERFLREHQELVMFASFTLVQASLVTDGAVDSDVREAVEAMIRTLRTLDSGLIYETKPTSAFAAQIQARVQTAFDDLRARMAEQTGMKALRDAEFLGVLVFLARVAVQHNNRRPRGRSFLDFLRSQFPPGPSNQSQEPDLVAG
jgi:hypothetical protein